MQTSNPNAVSDARTVDSTNPQWPHVERRKRDRSIARCHAGLLDTSFMTLDVVFDATLSRPA
jgi:hypothetical protein